MSDRNAEKSNLIVESSEISKKDNRRTADPVVELYRKIAAIDESSRSRWNTGGLRTR